MPHTHFALQYLSLSVATVAFVAAIFKNSQIARLPTFSLSFSIWVRTFVTLKQATRMSETRPQYQGHQPMSTTGDSNSTVERTATSTRSLRPVVPPKKGSVMKQIMNGIFTSSTAG